MKKSDELRKRRNEELLKRMKDGEVLCSYDSKESWFPPRPIIKKDKKALKRLYDKAIERQERLSEEERKIIALGSFKEDTTDDDLTPAS